MKKSLLCALLSAVLVVTCVTPVLADREDDVRAARDANKSTLSQTESAISNAESAKEQVNNEIADLDNQLVNLIASMEILKGDITRRLVIISMPP